MLLDHRRVAPMAQPGRCRAAATAEILPYVKSRVAVATRTKTE
jgi:hypothetical protein